MCCEEIGEDNHSLFYPGRNRLALNVIQPTDIHRRGFHFIVGSVGTQSRTFQANRKTVLIVTMLLKKVILTGDN